MPDMDELYSEDKLIESIKKKREKAQAKLDVMTEKHAVKEKPIRDDIAKYNSLLFAFENYEK